MSEIHPDVLAAFEYFRRYKKGLPTDRFCDGQSGAIAVARGIERMANAVAYSVAEIERLEAEIRKRGIDAMEAWRDPKRAE